MDRLFLPDYFLGHGAATALPFSFSRTTSTLAVVLPVLTAVCGEPG
jgi:hypothetical protein